MKKYLILLFLYCYLSYDSFSQTLSDAVIKGYIYQSKKKHVEFLYQNNPLDDTLQRIRVELNEMGRFSINLPIQRPLSLILKGDSITENLYIEPQETIEVFAYEKKENKLTINSDYKNNEYLLEYKQRFSDEKINKLRERHIIEDSPESYQSFEDSLLKAKIELLNTYIIKNNLSKNFVRRVKAEYVYGAANAKFNYPTKYTYLTGKRKDIADEYYDFMMYLTVTSNDLLSVSEFFNYLSNYYTYRYNTENVSLNTEEELISFEYNLADRLYEDNIRTIFLTKKFGEILESHPYELTKKYISSFMSEVRSNEYRKYIDKKIEEATKGTSDTKAYNFKLLDQNGKTVNLSDFAGKNIYLNFWASWCLPCLAEINNHNEIQRTYNDKNFITIMVSIDEDINAWKKTLKEYDKKIIQLHVSGMENEVVKKYNVKSIPKSFMINKDGIIIHSSVPSPTNINVHKYLLFD